jgi:hypothetical protein
LVTQVVVQTTQVAVVMVTVLPLEDIALHQVDMVPTVVKDVQVESVVMDLVVL